MITTFQKSPVGFSTIIGSAIFNVLFVIGVCAVAAGEPLQLTWWPLFRDCLYYVFCLLVLVVFFGLSTPREIQAWEATVLLCCYLGYVTIMRFNDSIHNCLTRRL